MGGPIVEASARWLLTDLGSILVREAIQTRMFRNGFFAFERDESLHVLA